MPEFADIFHKFGEGYKRVHKLPMRMIKTMNAIENCRTATLGGHVDVCESCGHTRISYNSCRNRHCPKCQGIAREKWLIKQKKDLLPIHYFHVVFTIPDSLNSLALRNQKEIYSILFKASSQTLVELGGDTKYLGVLIDELYEAKWVVYCKPPFKNAEFVLEYLGRYTHRVAISNSRIVSIENDKVTFKWRDYRDNNKEKLMTLHGFEFIRRFLMHVLPDGFVKIRHYGFLSNKNRKTKLKSCKKLLGVSEVKKREHEKWEDMLLRLTGIDMRKCPCCNNGRMVRQIELKQKLYVPPDMKKLA